MACIKRKELESYLEDVDTFTNPKIQLEQYATSPHIAACMLYTAQTSYGDIENKVVVDFGCGCGILSIGAKLLGAELVIAVDVDAEALAIAKKNIDELELTGIDLIQCDVDTFRFSRQVDTVMMNPPFGTKMKGIDLVFVKRGLEVSAGSVYSLHKTATRGHIIKKVNDWGVKMQVLANLRYNLPQSYKFHKKSTVDIEVDYMRFTNKPVMRHKQPFMY